MSPAEEIAVEEILKKFDFDRVLPLIVGNPWSQSDPQKPPTRLDLETHCKLMLEVVISRGGGGDNAFGFNSRYDKEHGKLSLSYADSKVVYVEEKYWIAIPNVVIPLCEKLPAEMLEVECDFRGKKLTGEITYVTPNVLAVILGNLGPFTLEDIVYVPASKLNELPKSFPFVSKNGHVEINRVQEIARESLRILKLIDDAVHYPDGFGFILEMYDSIKETEANRHVGQERISYQKTMMLERHLYSQWRLHDDSPKDYQSGLEELFLMIPRIDDTLGRVEFSFSQKFTEEYGVVLPVGLVRMLTLTTMRRPLDLYEKGCRWQYQGSHSD